MSFYLLLYLPEILNAKRDLNIFTNDRNLKKIQKLLTEEFDVIEAEVDDTAVESINFNISRTILITLSTLATIVNILLLCL